MRRRLIINNNRDNPSLCSMMYQGTWVALIPSTARAKLVPVSRGISSYALVYRKRRNEWHTKPEHRKTQTLPAALLDQICWHYPLPTKYVARRTRWTYATTTQECLWRQNPIRGVLDLLILAGAYVLITLLIPHQINTLRSSFHSETSPLYSWTERLMRGGRLFGLDPSHLRRWWKSSDKDRLQVSAVHLVRIICPLWKRLDALYSAWF